MGTATRKRKVDFYREHPFCVFCGGEAPTTTVEHCPPRAMFQNRLWPEGFEFPACSACNHGSSNEDLLVAMLARVNPFEETGDTDGRFRGLVQGVNKQYPGLIQKMMPTAVEARRSNRRLKLTPAPGQTHQEVGAVKITSEMDEAVSTFARKLAKGIYYKDAGKTFPKEGCLLMNWFTNEQLFKDGRYISFEILQAVDGVMPALVRTGKYLNDQFEYKLSMSNELDVFILQAMFGQAFGLVIYGSIVPGKLEPMLVQFRETGQRSGPFTVLESMILPIGRVSKV
jgi:hypothetical protein